MDNICIDDVYIPTNIHIFILEDTATFQKKMQEDLLKIGFKGNFTLVATVKDAIAGVLLKKPDLVLADWNLPDGIGIELLRMVRGNESIKDIPFVMVTTMDEIDNILEAVENGVDGYVIKPWTVKDLSEKISYAYQKRNKIPNLPLA